MKYRAGPGCVVALIALCAVLIYLAWRARTAPQVGESFAQLSPAQQQERRAATQQLTDQLHSVRESGRRKEHKPFTLVVTEPVLNTLLQDNVKLDKFPVRDLRAGLEPNRLILQGTINYHSLDTTATLSGSVTAQHGQLAYQAESLKLGGVGLSVSDKVRQRAERTISEKLNGLLKSSDAQVTQVTTEQGKLIIEGVTD